MAGTSRRDFLAGTASFGLAAAAGGLVRAQAAMGPNDKFDLVIKGGDVRAGGAGRQVLQHEVRPHPPT